jgi:hypothetical protein
VTGASTATDASGIATVGSWTLGTAAGTNTVAATGTPPYLRSGILGSPLTFTATALAPTQVAFTVQPSLTMAGSAITPSVQVAIEDQNGSVVTSSSAPVTLALSPGSVALGGTTTVNAVNGVATFTGLTITKAGTGYTLLATSGSLTSATSTPFAVTAAAPAAIQVAAGNNQHAREHSAVAVPPSVRVTDAYGNPVPGVTVTFTVGYRSGSITGPVQVTDTYGIARVGSWTIVEEVNHLYATAAGAGIAGNPVTFTAYGTEK